MAKRWRKMLLTAKAEVTPGTDSAPTAPLNAMLVRGLTPQPITAEYVSRDLVRPYMGNNDQLPSNVHRMIEFEIELAGSGDAGEAPAYGPLLVACGLAQTIVADTSVSYQPSPTDAATTCTLHVYLDGIRYTMTQCLGSVNFALTAKGIPVMQFRFIGNYVAPTDTALPTDADFDAFLQPRIVGRLWTPTAIVHGETVCLQSINFDLANQLIFRDLVGCGGPAIVDRAPAGNVVFELTTVAAHNWAEAVRLGTNDEVQIVHGSEAGNIITIDAPAVQLNNYSLQEQDRIAMNSMGMAINPVAGNDELVITLT